MQAKVWVYVQVSVCRPVCALWLPIKFVFLASVGLPEHVHAITIQVGVETTTTVRQFLAPLLLLLSLSLFSHTHVGPYVLHQHSQPDGASRQAVQCVTAVRGPGRRCQAGGVQRCRAVHCCEALQRAGEQQLRRQLGCIRQAGEAAVVQVEVADLFV